MLLILKSYIRKMCLLIIIILTLTLITNDLDIAGKKRTCERDFEVYISVFVIKILLYI